MTKDEKKVVLSKILVNVKGDNLYPILEDLYNINDNPENMLTDEEVKDPDNRQQVTNNRFVSELIETIHEINEQFHKLKLLKGLLDE